MSFFIVDNGSSLLSCIANRITQAGHTYAVQTYSPFEPLNPANADAIILSGGMRNEVAEDLENGDPWYRHEFELIRTTDKPIFGICLGLQMITAALGGSLSQLPKLVESDTKQIDLTAAGRQYFASDTLYAHEKHQWVVDSYANTGLELLATSEDGIEILRHQTRPIIGTQFHPEYGDTPEASQLFWDVLGVVCQPQLAGVIHEA